jgi:hypothetical protein
MSDLDHARSLLEMAKGDLNALRGMTSPALALIPELFSDEVFGFHAQQAVEKCLKAWIASLGQRYTRTHDLMALIEDLENAGEDTSELLGFVDLNAFAVQYRYESLDSEEEALDRSELLHEIQSLFQQVDGRINPAA